MAPSVEEVRMTSPKMKGLKKSPPHFRDTLFSLARSLAKIPNIEWNLVRTTLFKHCPDLDDIQPDHQLGEQSQDSILALGIFVLESKFSCADKILDYLLRIFDVLDSVKIGPRFNNEEKIPCAENFTFCFNSLMSDIAANAGVAEFRGDVFKSQTELFRRLAEKCENCQESLCKIFGLARSLGRFGGNRPEQFLISKLFPPKKRISEGIKVAQEGKNYSNFRSIIPRNLGEQFQVP